MKKIALLLLIVASACGNKDEKDKVSQSAGTTTDMSVSITEIVGTGRVEPESEIVSLAAVSGGIVKRVVRLPGSMVSKNDTLILLDDEIEKMRIEQLRSQYLSQQSQEEIDRNSLKESEIRLESRKKLLNSVKNLVGQNAESRQTLEDLATEVAALESEVERAKASVSLSGHRLNELAGQVKLARTEAERKILRSPFDGTLLDVLVSEGSAIRQYDQYAEVAPSGRLTVRSEVDELFAGRLSEGLPAEIRYIGSDSTIATGKIVFLSPYLKKKSLFSEKASEQEDRLVRELRILLDEGSDLLFNSEVECIIKL